MTVEGFIGGTTDPSCLNQLDAREHGSTFVRGMSGHRRPTSIDDEEVGIQTTALSAAL